MNMTVNLQLSHCFLLFLITSNESKTSMHTQMRLAETKTLLAIKDSDRGLINAFNGKIATPEQLHDLLNFRAIGKELFTQRIQYYILRSPSVCAPT